MFFNFFHQSRVLGGCKQPGWTLAHLPRKGIYWIDRQSLRVNRKPKSQIQENKQRREGHGQGSAVESLSAGLGCPACLGDASCCHLQSICRQLLGYLLQNSRLDVSPTSQVLRSHPSGWGSKDRWEWLCYWPVLGAD